MHPQPHAIHLKTALTDLSGSVGAFVLNCRNYVRVKHCRLCDDEGWVCEAHPEQTWKVRMPAPATLLAHPAEPATDRSRRAATAAERL
jgi:hypothetical protein